MKPFFPPSPEQKEQARHGEHVFPLIKYTTQLSGLFSSVTAHWHDEAELTLITEGECIYQIYLETFTAEKGDILFVPPAALHSITAHEKMTSDTYVFHMNFLGASSADICAVRYLLPITRQDLSLPFLITKEHSAYSKMLSLFHQINHVYEARSYGYELILKSLFLQAVGLLLPYAAETSKSRQAETEHTLKLKSVLEYIGDHYTEDLSIASLAKRCYFSEYHFMRFFKKYVGVSCLEYIKDLRLEHAAELLADSPSILDAALSSGFSNLSYFYREFKKKYGMTPKKYIESGAENRRFSPVKYR